MVCVHILVVAGGGGNGILNPAFLGSCKTVNYETGFLIQEFQDWVKKESGLKDTKACFFYGYY